MDDKNIFIEHFNGRNYFLWEFAFRMYVIGKDLWGIVDGSLPQPNETKPVELSQWKINNAKVINWMLATVDPHIATNLRAYKTAAGMWKYLEKVYHQTSDARRFQLENELAAYNQGDRSIQEYYSGFMNLWLE